MRETETERDDDDDDCSDKDDVTNPASSRGLYSRNPDLT